MPDQIGKTIAGIKYTTTYTAGGDEQEEEAGGVRAGSTHATHKYFLLV
jgi:hypothetical protein